MAYRAHIDYNMSNLLKVIQDKDMSAFEKFLVIGINHEQQHQELLVTDIKYILYNNPLMPAYLPEKNEPSTSSKKDLEFLPVSGGIQRIGFEGEGFAWDNEKPAHDVYLDDFHIANRLVTNGEYLDFMKDGGYSKFSLWQGEGWDKVKAESWQAPLYWDLKQIGNG